jgi:hypothetical protein
VDTERSGVGVRKCEETFDAAMDCGEHTHCATCGTLLDFEPLGQGSMFATCRECWPPFFPANDSMDPLERQRWEWELKNR